MAFAIPMRVSPLCLLLAFLPLPLFAVLDHTLPDSLEMKDGTVLHGVILRNTADEVLLETANGDQSVPKSSIRRINDAEDLGVFFADLVDPGTLPPWRMMVTDFRNHDSVKRFEQIPATAIDNGYLKNVPYLSFRINGNIEMNIYGDPKNPACLEFGIYGYPQNKERARRVLREFLAGYLPTREEIRVLYSLDFKGDLKESKNFVYKITPRTSPDAYGGWWISIYNPRTLEAARLSDKQYAALTLPFDQVNASGGKLREDTSKDNESWLDRMMLKTHGKTPVLRGFYRDEQGIFRLIKA